MNKRFIYLLLFFFIVAGLMVFQATRATASLVLLPSDLIALEGKNMERIRVGGRVTTGEIKYQLEPSMELRFHIEDPKDPKGSIPVFYKGLKPDMFTPGRDVLIDGDFEGGTLNAQKLLTQCPSKYEPPKPQ